MRGDDPRRRRRAHARARVPCERRDEATDGRRGGRCKGEREGEWEGERASESISMCVCVCVCVCAFWEGGRGVAPACSCFARFTIAPAFLAAHSCGSLSAECVAGWWGQACSGSDRLRTS